MEQGRRAAARFDASHLLSLRRACQHARTDMPAHGEWITSWHALWMFSHMAGALLLGWVVGYERYFSGRAAGSQVYCLVSVTSCAITLMAGLPSLWYWGSSTEAAADPTRVVGAILTGIGFLGAGIIVQSGINVRGLTTAASIWGSAAIGILVGVGFYLPAVGLSALFVVCMALVPRIEHRLPSHRAIAATLAFRVGYKPQPERIHAFMDERGLSIPSDSVTIVHHDGRFELQCLIFGDSIARKSLMTKIVADLTELPDVENFTVAHSSRA
jgi:putative Mg2+ transporter-C (MgtC) family protein